MGRGTPPKWSIDRLMSLAKNAVIDTVQQWREHPYRYSEYGEQHKPPTYEEAREFVLERSRILEEYPCGIDSYGSPVLCLSKVRRTGAVLHLNISDGRSDLRRIRRADSGYDSSGRSRRS